VGSPRPARTQNFAWQLVWLALCKSKIAVFLGVVSFLWFVSLDKQRNEQKSIINALAVNSFVPKEKLKHE
jgi:hypothetical protein